MSVTRINHFEARKDSTDKLQAFMHRGGRQGEDPAGCRSVRLLQSTENPTHFAVVEEWDSIEAHQKAATTIPPEQLEEAKKLVAKPPVGEYFR
jgi:quinol monooxygenase YgiN